MALNTTYRLFFSWQNDVKETKKIIFDSLFAVQKMFEDNGITLVIDHDTRERVGKKKIEDDVRYKIENCDIFVADLTPVMTRPANEEKHRLAKHMPNSNVMYEYGYAQKCKGDSRMMIFASLDKNKDEHIEFMPFDINHDTINLFNSSIDTQNLYNWIENIMKDVDEERAQIIPTYASSICFKVDGSYQESVIIKPEFLKYRNVGQIATNTNETKSSTQSIESIINGSLLKAGMTEKPVKIQTVKAITKKIYRSYSPLTLIISNDGTNALDNVKIQIWSDDNGIKFRSSNEEDFAFKIKEVINPNGLIVQEDYASKQYNTINPSRSYKIGDLYIYVPYGQTTSTLKWSVSTRNGRFSGELNIFVEPQEVEKEAYSTSKSIGAVWIEDYVESV